MYKEYIYSDDIQKSLIDPLRKGQTILPAIECLNLIEVRLLNLVDIENAGKVLIDFSKSPKKFTFCKYPLMLCCLVCEFSLKCKSRFPIYEDFFEQINKAFSLCGHLFVNKIKKDDVLEYHLNQKDLRNRTCIQIMSQNRLYKMLEDPDVSAIIGKYWNGTTIQFGFFEFSCFTHLFRRENYQDILDLNNFSMELNKENNFFFNYYSYRDISSIRYYFQRIWYLIIVILLTILVFYSVTENKDLNYTKNNHYALIQNVTEFGIYLLMLNKINSILFFLFIEKWWIEIESNILDIILILTTIYHFRDISKYYEDIVGEEVSNSISIAIILIIVWFKLIKSLFSFKILGGFIRTMIMLVKNMSYVIFFYYGFILMATGVFNLIFTNIYDFSSYLNAFFNLFQASVQEYEFINQTDLTIELKISIALFMFISTSILTNLIIALSTNIYQSVFENVESEYRASLVEIYEYFKWDNEYGFLKFVSAPFNLIQIPFELLLLFSDNKAYWNSKFCMLSYGLIGIIYTLFYMVFNFALMIASFFYIFVTMLNKRDFLKALYWIFAGLFYVMYFYFLDFINLWVSFYIKPYLKTKEEEALKQSLNSIKSFFPSFIAEISQRIFMEKKRKQIDLSTIVFSWLKNMHNHNSNFSAENLSHKKSFLQNKYKQVSNNKNILDSSFSNIRASHKTFLVKNESSIIFNIIKLFEFIEKFADSDGKIDIDLAKKIFPQKNYYEDEYFLFLHYFDYNTFGGLLKNNKEGSYDQRKEMNKLRGVLIDIEKINKKIINMKFILRNINLTNIEMLEFCINNINSTFAIFEKNLMDKRSTEELNKVKVMMNSVVENDANKTIKTNTE